MTCYRTLPHRLADGLKKGLRLVPVMAATLSLAACQSYDTTGGNVVETLLFSPPSPRTGRTSPAPTTQLMTAAPLPAAAGKALPVARSSISARNTSSPRPVASRLKANATHGLRSCPATSISRATSAAIPTQRRTSSGSCRITLDDSSLKHGKRCHERFHVIKQAARPGVEQPPGGPYRKDIPLLPLPVCEHRCEAA